MSNNNASSGNNTTKNNFSGRLGYVLAVAGSAVGLGNIWRFPYLAAKYGGGIFLLVYLILMLTFGFSLIMAESALGRMTGKSPIHAFQTFGKGKFLKFGGFINAIIPMIIVPYYSVIGGWVLKYLIEYIKGNEIAVASDTYFSEFIAKPAEPAIYFSLFIIATLLVIAGGVQKGVERASKIMMPILVILAIIVCIYSVTRPGAVEGVKYFLIPDFSKFSLMTVVTAMGQMFYSLSIAMGILVTYGSYMKKNVDMEKSTTQIEIFDTGIAILAGLMIIPAVFAFSGGAPETLNAGPSLMFITIPKVFASMGFGRFVGAVFFLLVLFAALTSSISLMETSVSTLCEAFGIKRNSGIIIMLIEALVIGIPCSLGFGPLSFINPLGVGSILDFLDFLSNSVMMPIAALCTCFLIVKIVGFDKFVAEIKQSSPFKREKVFRFCIKYLAPFFLVIILLSSIANAFGLISM